MSSNNSWINVLYNFCEEISINLRRNFLKCPWRSYARISRGPARGIPAEIVDRIPENSSEEFFGGFSSETSKQIYREIFGAILEEYLF